MERFSRHTIGRRSPLLDSSPDAGTSAFTQGIPVESFKAVLEVTATALEPERFTAASMAVVTALAARFACDRVSLGLAPHGRLRVQALSHSVELNRKSSLVAAIASAMEETLDQQQSIVIPCLPNSPVQITPAYEELSRRYGASAICSIPLWACDRIIGVLTFERGGEQPFDTQTVHLCETIAGIVSPLWM